MKAMAKRLAALEAAAKRQDVQDPHTLPLSFWIVTGHPPGGYDDSQSMAANLCRSVGMDYGTFHNNPAMEEGLPAAILVRFVALMRERGAVLSDKPTLDEIHGPENWEILEGLFSDLPEVFARTLPFPELADYRL